MELIINKDKHTICIENKKYIKYTYISFLNNVIKYGSFNKKEKMIYLSKDFIIYFVCNGNKKLKWCKINGNLINNTTKIGKQKLKELQEKVIK